MEHLLADKLVTVSVAVRDVGGEGGLAGPVRVPLDDELGAEGGVRSDLLHHHRAPLLTQLQWSTQLLALLSKVELDICRTNSQQLNRDLLRRREMSHQSPYQWDPLGQYADPFYPAEGEICISVFVSNLTVT